MVRDLIKFKRIGIMVAAIIIAIFICNFTLKLLSTSNSLEKIPFIVIDLDQSEKSKELSGLLMKKAQVTIDSNINSAIGQVAKGKFQAAILINNGYEERLIEGRITDLFTVYTGYNPSYTKLLLEVISQEVLKDWVGYKVFKDSKELDIELDFKSVEELEVNELVQIRESTIDGEKTIILENSDKSEEFIVFILILVIISTSLIIIQGHSIAKDKISGVMKRVFLFNPRGKRFYLIKAIYEIVEVFIITTIIFTLVFFSVGIKIKLICIIFLLYLIYLIFFKIIIALIIAITNSVAIYNFLTSILLIMNSILIFIMLI